MQFTTYDVDNDQYSGNCATDWGGNAGNWYNQCLRQNMNGVYGADGNSGGGFMWWLYFDTSISSRMALKSMRWMIREVV